MPQRATVRRYRAAESLVQVQAAYARQGKSIALAAMAGSHRFMEWNHYPAFDLRDEAAGTIAYYHAHAASDRPVNEHGHFHLFVSSGSKRPDASGYSHLVGISVNARGEAFRLFTTNRWVTDEDWLPATHIVPRLAGFRLATAGRLAPVARWLTAMTCIYAADIGALLEQRDAVVESHARAEGKEAVLASKELQVLSQQMIDVPKRLLQIEEALDSAGCVVI